MKDENLENPVNFIFSAEKEHLFTSQVVVSKKSN